MKRNKVLSLVAAPQEQLKQLGVQSLDLFGFVACDEAHPNWQLTVSWLNPHHRKAIAPVMFRDVECFISLSN